MVRRRTRRAFTLLEALILVVVMSIVAVAAGVGLQSVARIPPVADATLAINRQIMSDLEQVRGTAWDSVTVGTTNNTVTINGRNYSRSVVVSTADANADGSADTDFRQISVTIGNQTLTTFVTKP